MKRKGNGKLWHSKSSSNIFHRKGESTLPCGQPSSVTVTLEARGLDRMQEREFRKLARNFTRMAGQFLLFRQFRIAGCQAASKADLISRNAQQAMTLFFLLFSIRLVRERVAVSVENPDLKPCWLGLYQLLAEAKRFNLTRIIFSNSLERALRILMGLKQLGWQFVLFQNDDGGRLLISRKVA